MNISVHGFVWNSISEYIGRRGADESHGNSMFNFPSSYQVVLLRGYIIRSSYKRSQTLEGLQILKSDVKRQTENI